MKKLTARQLEVLKFIKGYIRKIGYPPSRQEIADGFGWASCNAAEQHLRAIEKKGWIRIAPVSRGIVPL